MAINYAERADAYLHGLLTPEETAAFERDLADDAALRAALDVARRRLALLEAAHALEDRVSEALGRAGLSMPKFAVLNELVTAGFLKRTRTHGYVRAESR